MTRDRGVSTGLVCEQCGRLMLESVGCRDDVVIVIGGVEYPPVRRGEESCWSDGDEVTICHDCMAEPGQVHHYGCCVEPCPRCDDQLLFCGCSDEPRWVRRRRFWSRLRWWS